MTLANRITLVRLGLIPVFAAMIISYTRETPWMRFAAIGVYLAAAVSDALDGFIARAYNQKTKLGALLDPLADKLMINVGYVFLAVNDQFKTQMPAWLPVVILGRDVVIVTGSYLINELFGPIRVRPRITGKLTTVLQMSAVLVVLCEFDFAYPFLMATVAMTVVSFFDYIFAGIRQVGKEEST